MPNKSNPAPRQFKLGDRVKISVPPGRIVDATVKAVVERTDGVQLQVDYGNDQTALVHSRQVVE